MAPVIIPALVPTLDKSLKEDRTLCPVRAIRYYLDKIKDLRSGKELVFVSFRASRRTLFLPPSPPGLSKQLFYATNCPMNRRRLCTKFGHMMSMPSRLPKPSKDGTFRTNLISLSLEISQHFHYIYI